MSPVARGPGSIHGPGLSSDQARDRLAKFGPNSLPETPLEPGWHRLLRQFQSPLIYILVFALVVDLAVWLGEGGHGLPLEAIAIAVILLLNAGLGAWQERKAESALAKLATLATPQAWVLRDGKLARLDSRDLVPGDILRLEAGDRIPADGEVEAGESLSVDESIVTGESLSVEKSPGDLALAGTLIVRGSGYLEVTKTGAVSTMGRLATMLGKVEAEPTPLERRLRAFGRRMARWVLAIAVVVAAAGLLVEGIDRFAPIFLFAVALAVAAVPEGLPAVLTVTLTLGVERMARRKALVRRLAAVEALGSVTVIATDKTGTLTENRLEVRSLESAVPQRALAAMVLANDAELDANVGDPLELALLRYARIEGVDPDRLRADAPRSSSTPFDSNWKYMRVTVRQADRVVSYLKGAPEVILAACTMPDTDRRRVESAIDTTATAGYRLLALAEGDGEREAELTWLGLVALWDPPRPEVPKAVHLARAAGIRVIMVTGDHPATATTVARMVGIEGGSVITGAEIERMGPSELRRAATTTSLFARVSPEHKLRIVEALQAEGEIVAMTGDGVNDAAALKRADVGVAMGQRGSDVSREVADLVLLDDNFATIVAAVEEGRGIYENVQKFLRFLLSTNFSEVVVVTLGAAAAFLIGLRDPAGGFLLPLTAAQLLWINLVTDGAPALALGLDRNPGVMSRPPRNPKEPLLDTASFRFVALSGGVKAAIALVLLYALPRLLDQSLEATRSAVFLYLATGQLLFAYSSRRTDLTPLTNPILHFAVVGSIMLQLVVVSVPSVMAALGTVPLQAATLGVVAAAALLAWAVAQGITAILWRRS
ncbi:MAG: cation-translocating P-type ATPase [Gemmatimonadales bacterium]